MQQDELTFSERVKVMATALSERRREIEEYEGRIALLFYCQAAGIPIAFHKPDLIALRRKG
jgi:hypothetical protein